MKYQGKHCRRGPGGKAFTAMLALTLVLAAYWAVGGTAAWLAAKSEPIASTFTFGDINITLTETDHQEQIKIIPGVDIPKDLKVTVTADSVDCWLLCQRGENRYVCARQGYIFHCRRLDKGGWLPKSRRMSTIARSTRPRLTVSSLS